ncbi:MAG TPA: thioredoxin family protein [Gammaproteobacteria bacterium]|nr:thioredoxin family protein [Gammaproteobacteria bacterium]
MGVIALTQKNFDEVTQTNHCVIVDFWAPWCSPCLTFAKIFEKLSEKHPDIIFASVDIDKEPELADDFTIKAVPYLIIFREEFVIFAESGVQTEQGLEQLLAEAKKIKIEDLRKQIQESPHSNS